MRRRRLHMYTTTLGALGDTSGPRIDRIPPTRPPWWRRQFRELKKIFFSPPSKCPIALFGPLGNRTCLPTTRRLAPANCESVCDLQKHPYLEQPFALPTALLYSLLASTECLLLSTDKATIFFRRGSPPPRLFCRGVCRWPCVRRRTHIVYSKTSWLDLFHRRYYRAAESHLR